MMSLWTEDLALVLNDMLANRAAPLGQLSNGALYQQQLRLHADALTQDLAKTREAHPLAQDLADADARHDDLGGAIFAYCEAVARNPLTSPDDRERALRVQQAFIPTLADLQDGYVQEAAQAQARLPKLAELADDLRALPAPSGQTLFEWVAAFLDAGQALARLLEGRTQRLSASSGPSPRLAAISLLKSLRQNIRAELKLRPDLPRDLDAQVFAHLDALAAKRTAALRQAPSTPTPTA
jgi:hypothetical protein